MSNLKKYKKIKYLQGAAILVELRAMLVMCPIVPQQRRVVA